MGVAFESNRKRIGIFVVSPVVSIRGAGMTIYIDIRNTRSITAVCHYGESHYAGCSISAFEHNHEIANAHYYVCHALRDQQFKPICDFCLGNKNRKYMNEMRRIDNLEAE